MHVGLKMHEHPFIRKKLKSTVKNEKHTNCTTVNYKLLDLYAACQGYEDKQDLVTDPKILNILFV